LRELGSRNLKGFEKAVLVYQVEWRDVA
jgi:hypothetical protein